MGKFLVIPIIIMSVLLIASCAGPTENNSGKTDIFDQTDKENSLMIDKEKALEIAHKDASLAYRDLTIYEVQAALKEGNWYIDYELKNKQLSGGGPHYVISGQTGEIISKRYEQ